ncbi:MAG: cytochrome P450 [Planctomycetaceae bacterium]
MDNSASLRLDQAHLPISRGSLLQFPEDPIACMKRLHARHGDLAVLEDDGQRLVFIFGPEYNRQVLSDSKRFHSQFFAVRGGRRSAQRRVTSGLLSQNGAEHREGRRILMDVFSKKTLPGYHDTICDITQELIEDWDIGQRRDLNSEMTQYMLRLTAALLFGVDDAGYSTELGRMVDRWVHRNHEVGMGALVSSPEFPERYETLLSMADELEACVEQMFEKHRRRNSERIDILSLLFQAQQGGGGLSDDQLVGHTTLLFAAAHLTTAHTLSWTLFLLAQHPEVMKKLQAELDSAVDGPVPAPVEADRLTYMDQVIRESMRVLPASSYSQRICAEPVTLGPLNLRQGTPIIFSQYITHHRPDLFDEPDVFRPERWDTINPSPYEYLPFGAGPRMCIGAPLAMVELRTALTIILKRFHFQIEPGSTVNGQVVSTMLAPTSTIESKLLPTESIPGLAPVTGTIHDLVRLPRQAVVEQRRAA